MSNDKSKFENPGVERVVLCSLLQYPDLMVDAHCQISEDDFLTLHHRTLYSILVSLYLKGVFKFDLLSIVSCASENGLLDVICGAEYISALIGTPIQQDNFSFHVGKLLDISAKYRLFLTAQKIQENVLSNTAGQETRSSEDLLGQAETDIHQISLDMKKADDAIDLRTGLFEIVSELKKEPKKIVGMSTGLPLVDYLIDGAAPGSLTIFAARAKTGKSYLLNGIACHMSYKLNEPLLYIDTEMMTSEVRLRALSNISRVSEKRIKKGLFATDRAECARVDEACKVMAAGNNYFHRFFPGFKREIITSLAKKYKVRYGIKALFFDYIKLPDSDGLNSAVQEYQMLGFLATALKDLAGELEIPVITAAQLNRGAVGKSRVSEGDMAGSDRLSMYCNNLFALTRKTQKEIEEGGGFDLCGTHTLQLLLSRGNSPFYEGINLIGDLGRAAFKEAPHQPPGMGDDR